MNNTSETCNETITPKGRFGGFNSYRCGKPIKRDGMCGVHAAAEDRRKAGDRERAEKRSADHQRKSAAGERMDKLMELAGIDSFAHYDYHVGQYTGGIYLSPEETDRLIAKLVGE